MESRILFRDDQETQEADFTNLQDFIAQTIEAAASEGITPHKYFTGFNVLPLSPTLLKIDPGRFWNNGQSFPQNLETEKNIFGNLPSVVKRKIAVVAYGRTDPAISEPRDFLIDAETGDTEPQAVPMQEHRSAQIDVVAGVESADPVLPAIPDNSVLIAEVTLDTTGVVDIAYQTQNTLPSVEGNRSSIRDLELWRQRIGPQVEGIQTSVASLEDKTDDKADRDTVVRLASELARVRERQGLPDTFSLFGSDDFGDEDESETGAPQYDAIVDPDGGVTFPTEDSASINLALFNPIDDGVEVDPNDWCLPAYDEEIKLALEGFSGDVSMSQYTVQTHTVKRMTRWVHRWRWAWGWRSRWWWRNFGWRNYESYRWRWRAKWWYRYPVTIYREVTTDQNYNGVITGQTWLSTSAFWLTAVNLYLTQVAAIGDIQVVVCETDYGKPTLDRVVSSATIAQADLEKYPVATKVPMPPAVLEAGKRYAVMFITEGSHRMAVVDGNAYTQGTYFYGNDGAYFTGDITKNLKFDVLGAAFQQPRTEVALESAALSGGMTDVDVITESQVPDGSNLSYEVQIAGKWYPLDQADIATPKPNLLPVRAVFLGTRDVAPGIQLGPDRLKVSRPKAAVTHVSTLRSLPGADTTTNVTVEFRVTGYSDVDHTFVVRLLNAANAELATADSVSMEEEYSDDEEVVTKITAVFNTIGPAISEYKVEFTGTRSASARPFHVVERTDVAIAA